MGERVIDLQAARGRVASPAVTARRRFASARAATGLSAAKFAALLTEALGWPVTAEAVTGWETTAVPLGDLLCAAEAIAGTAPALVVVDEPVQPMRLLNSYGELQAELGRVVDDAEQTLAITGSRSREPNYLARIEAAVARRPGLVHTRVLYGPPRHSATKQHLLRLVDLQRDPGTLQIGILRDLYRDGERFIVASERTTLIVVPSRWSLHNFDTAVVIDDEDTAQQYGEHVRQAWLASEPLTTRADIEQLEVLR